MSDELLSARAAIARKAWADAYRLFSAAHTLAPLDVDDLELFATAACLVGEDDHSAAIWQLAHNEYLSVRQAPRAARCAFWLALDLMTRGEIAQASGWIARGERILDEAGADCAERGLLMVLNARLLAARDIAAATALAEAAFQLDARFGDGELRLFSLLIRAQTEVWNGRPARAGPLLDELMVAATVDTVSPIAVGVVYCAVIEACHNAFDLARAREWTSVLSRWCASQPNLVPFRGQCLIHRAEIMRLQGAWREALAEAESACTCLVAMPRVRGASAQGHVRSSAKYPVGAAFYEVAEMQRWLGNYSRAADAYSRANELGSSPEPGLSLLRLAEGRIEVARASIRRVLGERHNTSTRVKALSAGVEILLAAKDVAAARVASEELQGIASATAALLVRAIAAQARGKVLLEEGRPSEALGVLRMAWMQWQELEVPYEAARVRVLIGLGCRHLGDQESAQLEFDAARRVFLRLSAVKDLASVERLLRMQGGAWAESLTGRELQVIRLIAAGKTNRAIGQQLAISERTVDRHVSNILRKLGLASRSAATAYAHNHGLV